MQDSNKNDSSSSKIQSPVSSVSSSISKEHEGAVIGGEAVKEVSSEIKISPEVERVGVKKINDTVDVPPDVKSLGVTPAGSSTPVSSVSNIPRITLPISDQQILSGLGASVTSALAWLAAWCIRKLKKAHIGLKTVGGKVIRIRT